MYHYYIGLIFTYQSVFILKAHKPELGSVNNKQVGSKSAKYGRYKVEKKCKGEEALKGKGSGRQRETGTFPCRLLAICPAGGSFVPLRKYYDRPRHSYDQNPTREEARTARVALRKPNPTLRGKGEFRTPRATAIWINRLTSLSSSLLFNMVTISHS